MASVKRTTLKVIASLFLLSAALVMAYEVVHWFAHVYSGNARVQTELTKLSSRVDGTIDRILVDEGEHVKAGQLLIMLVDQDIRLNVEAAKADMALEKAQRARLVSEKIAFELELQSRLQTRRKQIEATDVEYRAAQQRLGLAKSDLERVKVLFNKQLASTKALAEEQDKVLIQQGEASRLLAKIQIAKSELDQVTATLKQVDVIEDRIKVSDITTQKLATTIEREEVSLSFRHIRSPIDAVVDRTYKHKGEYVEEGERILVLHDEQLFWVEAFIDEDQIRYVEIGQTALIHLPAYPFDDFFGKVLRIGSATAIELGIDTSSGGQFGRQAQRVPIRVSVDNPPAHLAPGMIAKVNVQIYDAFKPRSVFDVLKQRKAQ
ncbi:MAG: membrane fusion protein (multidrug efflux system) [Gammaproteobacteria bacterium]|jgi:membrane fusion protein (multidrug efflux system)